MKIKPYINLLFIMCISFSATAKTIIKNKKHTTNVAAINNSLPKGFKTQSRSSVSFTENKGQISDQNNKPRPDVLFSGNANNMTYHIRNNGISYQLITTEKGTSEKFQPGALTEKKESDKKTSAKTTLYQLDVAWVNSNTNFSVQTGDVQEGYSNYYLKNYHNEVTRVKTYTDVTLKNIYNNIDVHYYEKNGNLEYDYIVAPYTDYHQIQLQIGGATAIHLQPDGSIVLSTPLGNIKEDAPRVYQQNRLITATWKLNNNVLSFQIGHYNKSLPLVIDPVVAVARVWGTYYGGTGKEKAYGCTTDTAGNVYMTGFTEDVKTVLDTIASAGSHQITYGGGTRDAFLVKFNMDGVRQWGTYYGGSAREEGHSCATDVNGNVYMAGSVIPIFISIGDTASVVMIPGMDTIATPGSHQPYYGGGSNFYGNDAFLAQFNIATGTRNWATYYGSTGKEEGSSCATDAAGNVYLAGTCVLSASADIIGDSVHWFYSSIGDTIATSGSHQPNYAGGSNGGGDAFLAKFNAAGVRQWGTYYGSNPAREVGNICATDADGNVYLAGDVQRPAYGSPDMGELIGTYDSTSFSTIGSHQPSFAGGRIHVENIYGNLDDWYGDAFLVKFNAAGVRQWATYYGGDGAEGAFGLAIDASSNVYLAGFTSSEDASGLYPISTAGGYFPDYIGNGYLAKFNAVGARQWGTYFKSQVFSCATDASDNVFITGQTFSIDTMHYIATPSAWQPMYGGIAGPFDPELGDAESEDGFLEKFNYLGERQWGTYYGSTRDDEGFSCATDRFGHIYLAGYSSSATTDAIANNTAWQPTYGGGTPDTNQYVPLLLAYREDALLVQFIECTSSLGTPSITKVGDTLVASDAATYQWYRNGELISGATYQNYALTGDGDYTVCSTAHGEICRVCSPPFTINSFHTNVNEHTLTNAIAIYPNPNSGQFEIALQLNTQDNYTLELTNALGQVLYYEELKNFTGTYHKQLDETKYGAGIYLFRVKNSKEQSAKKVISF